MLVFNFCSIQDLCKKSIAIQANGSLRTSVPQLVPAEF